MAEYKALRGLTIRTIDGDASPLITGDIWYNSSARKIKGAKIGAGTWATTNNRNNSFYDGTGCGIQTAALAVYGAPGSGGHNNTEEYNGSTWTEVTDAPASINLSAGGGIQTSAVFGSGMFPDLNTESYEYDGTNWTEGGDINTARKGAGGSGASSTAAMIFGGEPPGPGGLAITEEYNGTSWTEVGDLQTSRYNIAGCGTTTATIGSTGTEPSTSDKGEAVEIWNGASWTEVTDTNTARHQATKNAAGTTTAALVAGGHAGPAGVQSVTEVYDGSSWTEVADLSTARQSGYGGGTATAALVSAGHLGPAAGNITEEFTQALAAVTFTSS